MKLSIIVPCYNEADNIQKLHDELLPVIEDMLIHGWHDASKEIHSAEMIFVDDGSRDETFSKLKNIFSGPNKSWVIFKFLKHETNLGLGAAIRTGLSKADGDIVVTVDSDGTYKFSNIPALIGYLNDGADIVTASPYHPQGEVVGVPGYRLLLSRTCPLERFTASTFTGAARYLNSYRAGCAVRSGQTIPSVTKFASFGSSPKSPP